MHRHQRHQSVGDHRRISLNKDGMHPVDAFVAAQKRMNHQRDGLEVELPRRLVQCGLQYDDWWCAEEGAVRLHISFIMYWILATLHGTINR